MSKYVIIGGSGFVGSRLISEINSSDIKNLDKNPSSLTQKSPFSVTLEIKKQFTYILKLHT